jgi:hypothetical protein
MKFIIKVKVDFMCRVVENIHRRRRQKLRKVEFAHIAHSMLWSVFARTWLTDHAYYLIFARKYKRLRKKKILSVTHPPSCCMMPRCWFRRGLSGSGVVMPCGREMTTAVPTRRSLQCGTCVSSCGTSTCSCPHLPHLQNRFLKKI